LHKCILKTLLAISNLFPTRFRRLVLLARLPEYNRGDMRDISGSTGFISSERVPWLVSIFFRAAEADDDDNCPGVPQSAEPHLLSQHRGTTNSCALITED